VERRRRVSAGMPSGGSVTLLMRSWKTSVWADIRGSH
jgi:hypothetical protein